MLEPSSLSLAQTVVLIAVAVALGLIGVVSANSYFLLGVLVRHRGEKPKRAEMSEWPAVSMIIPVYNEKEVAVRAVEACRVMDYPAGRLEVIVADDSDDETVELLDNAASRFAVNILRRKGRQGYKAGALQNALSHVSGELVSVIDADHVPAKDFLREAVPILEGDEALAFVQGRWAPEPEGRTLLSRSVGFALDAHFRFDYAARAKSDAFPFIVGAGSVIRRKALQDVGGWQADTLTEDLDLACRFSLAGWRGAFAEDAVSMTAYPDTFEAFKRQQYRWAKGQMECLRKHGWKVLTSTQMHLAAKVECLAFLSYYLLPGLLLLTVFAGAVLLAFILPAEGLEAVVASPRWLGYSLVTAAALAGGVAMHLVAAARQGAKRLLEAAFIVVAMAGMSLQVARANVEGLVGIKSPFAGTSRTIRVGNGLRPRVILRTAARRPFELLGFCLGAFSLLRSLEASPLVPAFSLLLAVFSLVWLLAAITP